MTNNSRKKIDLGGTWQIVFNPDERELQDGLKYGGWSELQSHPIQVPGLWNITYPDADGVGFYRTDFSVSDSWIGKPVLLHFEGATYRTEVWVNGKYIGSHEGGYTPFHFEISSFIKSGERNNLIVRIAAPSKTKVVEGMILKQVPLSKQSWYYTYGGIWGRVYLESCPAVACQCLTIDPDLRQESVQAEVTLHNRKEHSQETSLHITIIDPHGKVAVEQEDNVTVPPGVVQYTFTLKIPRPLPWSCDQPNLYHVELQIRCIDGEEDRQTITFGMRDFTVHDGQYFLNGQPINIRGILLQPNFPVNLITHPNRDMMIREITLAKEAGFNLIRTHIQPSPPGYLDLADEMGMMVYAESCLAWIRESSRLWDHGQREIKAMIDRDRNHPSVVFWGIYNENPRVSTINSKALVQLARSIDPTRVIVDNSGGSLAIDQDFGWVDRATVTASRETQSQRILDVHLYLGGPISRSMNEWLCKLGTGISSHILVEDGLGSIPVVEEFDRELRSYPGKIFVSEVGYGGMSDLDETVAGFNGMEDLLDAREFIAFRDSLYEGFRKRKLDKIFGSVHNLSLEAQQVQAIANTQQIEAILSNPRISGYVICQLNDVAWEFHAGLLDLWRNPKKAYYAARKVNQPQIIVLNPQKVTANLGEKVNIDLTLVNRIPMADPAKLNILVKDEQSVVLLNKESELTLTDGIQLLESLQFEIEVPGNYQVEAWLEVNNVTLAKSTETILAFDQLDWNGLTAKFTPFGKMPESKVLSRIFPAEPSLQNNGRTIESFIGLATLPATLNEEQWGSLFKMVETGGTAVIGALRPEDKDAIKEFTNRGINLELHPGVGSWMGCYHWIPDSDLFTGLPAGGLAKRSYAEILPKYILSEIGGETMAGSFRNTMSRLDLDPAFLWYSDIEEIPFGRGYILFCQYRIFDRLDHEAIASHLAFNVLRHILHTHKARIAQS